MGYYSSFSFDISENTKVDVEKAKEMEKYFADINSENIYAFTGVEFSLRDDILQDIVLFEYYGKFYDDRLFADKLSEILIDGEVKLHFSGEDGDRWGYIVSPGKVEEISYYGLDEKESDIMEKVKEILNGDNTAKKNQLLKILGMEV